MGLIPDDIDKKKAIILGVSGVAIIVGLVLAIMALSGEEGPSIQVDGAPPTVQDSTPLEPGPRVRAPETP